MTITAILRIACNILFLAIKSDSYLFTAREYDRQRLVADNAPFTGALKTNRAKNVVIKGNTLYDLTYEDFGTLCIKYPRKNRKAAVGFFMKLLSIM